MKRLTLQDMRTFLYKKGRLLYGAVFLFCLVLVYGLYRTYVAPTFDGKTMAGGSSETEEVLKSEGRKNLDEVRKKRLQSSRDESGQNTFSANVTNSGNSTSSSNSTNTTSSMNLDDESSLRGRQIYSLNKSLRPLPFEDPFFIHLVVDGSVDTLDKQKSSSQRNGTQTNSTQGSGNQSRKYRRGNTESNNNENYNNENNKQHNNRSNYIQSNNQSNKQSNNQKRSRQNHTGNEGYIGGNSRSSGDIVLMGIVQGHTTLALIQTSNGDGAYAEGEGNGDLYVKSIDSGSVLVVYNGVERRLYIQ